MPDDDRSPRKERPLRAWGANSIHPGEELLEQALRDAEARGDLDALKGKPLDLDDDPDWLMMRVLKGAGFSHPAIEQAKEIGGRQGEAEEKIAALRRRRDSLFRRGYTPEQAAAFNAERAEALAAYRKVLAEVRRETLSYNLTVPDRLQHRLPNLDEAMAHAERDVPALPPPPEVPAQPAQRRFGFRRGASREDRRETNGG